MNNKAFTLVELAIVIVIIGLLVAGVLQGAELIKAAKRNSVVKEYESFKAAIITFKGKYGQLPGDTNKGPVFFADESFVGDMNGAIAWSESDYAWRHLSKAKLIKGTYNGTGDILATTADSPSSSFAGAGWSFLTTSTTVTSTVWFGVASYAHNTLLNFGGFGGPYYNGPYYNSGQILTTEDAYLLDSKMDDGLPYKGILVGPQQDWSLDCVTGVAPNYTWNLDVVGSKCYFHAVVN